MDRRKGCFNTSLKFASDHIAVVSDGSGMLYVVHTGKRSRNDRWQILFSDEIIGQGVPFIVADVALRKNRLHCLLLSIRQRDSDIKHYSKVRNVYFY